MTAPMTCSVCDCVVTRTGKVRAYSCHGCGSTLCALHAVYYVDGNNRAVNDGPPWCEACYGKRYGRRLAACRDCGEPTEKPLCDDCAGIAAVLGFTVEKRLALLEARSQQVFDLEALA